MVALQTGLIGCLGSYNAADPIALEQVFRNNLENAIYVSRPGDEVVIRARESNFAGRNSLEIRVCDNGPGLDATQASQIFEPFFTTKTQGTGLGMAIVKRIVLAHGGHISVGQRSCPGAEIILILPRSGDK
jgi:signal transduction histidine kinase